MKKALFVFSFAFVFAVAGVAHADVAPVSVVCNYPDHAIWNNDNSAKIGCITDGDWQKAIANQINQSDVNDFVKVPVGQKLMTTYGFVDQCPSWFPASGCVIKKALFVNWVY